MMTYWDLVLREVVNKNHTAATFSFTHRDTSYGGGGKPPAKRIKRKQSFRKYSLGPKYPNVFFTHQESECMKLAIRGKTIPKIAESLKLSPRTVEFYFCKMRHKLHCSSKSELIEKVIESDFLKNVGLQGF